MNCSTPVFPESCVNGHDLFNADQGIAEIIAVVLFQMEQLSSHLLDKTGKGFPGEKVDGNLFFGKREQFNNHP
jgi:hypothetical protein